MPFFSIIIPVYNVEAYLERCLDSILQDRCRDLEIILVDDGSTDKSGLICDRYAADHPGIRVVHKENGGLSSARNAGLALAEGEWISFIDSDDWVDPDSFLTMQALLSDKENASSDMVKFGYKKVFKDQVRDFIPCLKPGIYDREDVVQILLPAAFGSGRISDSTMNTIVLSACAHLYKRSFLENTGIRFVSERGIGSEDFLFIYSLYMRSSKILVTDLKWYNYDTRGGSLTQRYREKLYGQYKKLGRAVWGQLRKTGLLSRLREDFAAMYIELMYICIMNECVCQSGRMEQIRRVGRILEDRKLQSYLRTYHAGDRKSYLISRMMRYRAALPLCMIQWRKADSRNESIC